MLDDPKIEEGKLVTLIDVERGQPFVVQVEKTGRKYYHARGVFKDSDDGDLKACYWIGKYDRDKYVVLKGARWDLEERYRGWRAELSEFETRRRDARYGFEREAFKWVDEKMEEWEQQNPKPRNPIKR